MRSSRSLDSATTAFNPSRAVFSSGWLSATKRAILNSRPTGLSRQKQLSQSQKDVTQKQKSARRPAWGIVMVIYELH
jgi:hypothetical protein